MAKSAAPAKPRSLLAKALIGLHAEHATELGVVAEFGVRVERQVVGKEIDVVREQQLNALLHQPVMRPSMPRQNRPWCTKIASAFSAMAASMSARLAVTPLTMREMFSLPSTCRPFGP